MSGSPSETVASAGPSVPATVLHVEDHRAAPTPAVRPIGTIGGLVRLAFRITGLVRKPLTAPLALATAPLARTTPAGDRPVVGLRFEGHDVDVDELIERLSGVHAPTDRLLVLVPPPGSDESVWERGRDQTGATYGERLQAVLGWSPVALRVESTGGYVESAVALSALLQRLVDRWPVSPSRVVLIGAGLGGIVARSATGVATSGMVPWSQLLTEVIAVDTPGYAVTTGVASRSGKRIDEHLAGIAVVEEAVVELAPLDGVDYLLVSDEIEARSNPVGSLLGSLMWWRHRMVGRPRKARDLFPTAERFRLSSADGPLVNHPHLHDALLRWLA